MKTLFEYWAFCILAALYKALPLPISKSVSAWCWRKIAPLTHRHERARKHLLKAFPQLTQAQTQTILLNMWGNLGEVTAEGFHLPTIALNPSYIEVPNDVKDILENLKTQNQGAVFVSLHMGNWELVSLPGTQGGLSMLGIYQRLRNERVNTAMLNMRKIIYGGGLYDKGHQAVKSALAHVRSGGIVGLLADLRDAKGISVPFFGHLAPTNTFPALLALRTNAPLFAAATVRTDDAKTPLKLICVPITYQTTGNTETDILSITTQIQNQFEVWVKQYPEQWMWAPRRWG